MPVRKTRPPTDAQVGRFHHEIVELIKKYQFRDRNQMVGCGISVSQCYLLECLARFGPQTMNELARRMYLTVSTLTRLVDQLEAKSLVTRREDADDRRVRRIQPTARGRSVFQASWRDIFVSERAILESFPESQRTAVIEVLRKLNEAAQGWRAGCGRRTPGQA
jgi:DNA-binding MarR family transcriptional regulator